jgi:homoserine kinase
MAMPRAEDPSTDERDIVVPGSVSNLGPAFDSLAVAVRLFLCVRVVDVRPSEPDVFECRFVDAPLVGDNRIEQAFRHARRRIGIQAPGVSVEVRTEIPSQAGLGSSGAATVAGLRLYELITNRPSADWLTLACEVEGHPDNVAAAISGGLTLSCVHDDGRVTARTWRWPMAIRLVVATPAVRVETSLARSVLPASIGMRDAVFNLQRALMLVHALENGCYDDLREAMRDRWHQPFRAPLMPGLTDALALDHPAVLGVSLSGAGPSIVALTSDGGSDVASLFADIFRRLDLPCTVRTLDVYQSEKGNP